MDIFGTAHLKAKLWRTEHQLKWSSLKLSPQFLNQIQSFDTFTTVMYLSLKCQLLLRYLTFKCLEYWVIFLFLQRSSDWPRSQREAAFFKIKSFFLTKIESRNRSLGRFWGKSEKCRHSSFILLFGFHSNWYVFDTPESSVSSKIRNGKHLRKYTLWTARGVYIVCRNHFPCGSYANTLVWSKFCHESLW